MGIDEADICKAKTSQGETHGKKMITLLVNIRKQICGPYKVLKSLLRLFFETHLEVLF